MGLFNTQLSNELNFQQVINSIIKLSLEIEAKGKRNNLTRNDLYVLRVSIQENIEKLTTQYFEIVKSKPTFNIRNYHIQEAPAQISGLMALMGIIETGKMLEVDLNAKILNEAANKLYQMVIQNR